MESITSSMEVMSISTDKKMLRVYLAGPTVFEENPEAVFEEMKRICLKHGLEGVSPLDAQLGLENVPLGEELLSKIIQADFDLMDVLDAGIFCLDPFRRSSEMDSGTAVEIGYMKAQKKPLAGWTIDGRLYPKKVGDFFAERGKELVKIKPNERGGTSGAFRDPDGILVHSDTKLINAMAQFAIEFSGGKIGIDSDWKKAFEQGVISIKEQFIARGLMKTQEKIALELS